MLRIPHPACCLLSNLDPTQTRNRTKKKAAFKRSVCERAAAKGLTGWAKKSPTGPTNGELWAPIKLEGQQVTVG